MTVRHNFAGSDFAHFDVRVALAASRAGAVEGLLGDADGDPSNDIALPGGALVPQPVSFEGLYRGPQSFSEQWRVAGGTSLFVYGEWQSGAKYREYPYSVMPLVASSAPPPYAAEAAVACEDCPPSLVGTCTTDVGYTGNAAFADACLHVPVPVEEITVESKTYGVRPEHGSTVDCIERQFTFRAPGAAQADTWGTAIGFKFEVEWFGQYANDPEPPAWHDGHQFVTSNPPPAGWLDLECHDIGLGWGQCTWSVPAEGSVLCMDLATKFRWSLTRVGEGEPAFTYEFNVTDPAPDEEPVI
jgi:hypothetical protein